MTGLAFVEGTRDGTVAPAPVAQTLGWQVEDVAEGKVTLHLDVAEHLMHGGGIVHGGVLSALLDSAMANAVLSTLAGGHGCTTLQMNVNFVRSVGRQSRWLRCEGRARHVGRRTANAEAQLADDQGHLCATASSVYLLVAPPADKA